MITISVMVPTRRRVPQLETSLKTLVAMAVDPGALEILTATDPDDTPPGCHLLVRRLVNWVAPRRYGYNGLHHYYNQLATMADGQWLMIWNDDTQMLTPGWDQIITGSPPRVLWPQANHNQTLNLFPAWPAAWTRKLGHVSLSPHCDTWMEEVGRHAGLHRAIPVTVYHDRADITSSSDNNDETYRQGRALITESRAAFYGPALTTARLADALTIRETYGQ